MSRLWPYLHFFTRLNWIVTDKRTSLSHHGNNDEESKLNDIETIGQCYKTFLSVFLEFL
jgi:hypothetical protein